MNVFSSVPDFTNKFFRFRVSVLLSAKTLCSLLSGGEKCVCCGKKVFVFPLCVKCKSLLRKSSQSAVPRCEVCGKPLVSEIGLCSSCRLNPVLKSPDGVFPVFSYRLWKKTLLFSWKMQEKRSLSSFFASLVHEKLLEIEEKCDGKLPIIPVPPRPGKIREKGWDQIEDLCFYLSKGWNVKILRLLKRNSKKQQKKLDRVQRLENIESAYSVSSQAEKGKIKIPEKAVLLDDVLTTGSTVENCVYLLKKLGIKEVYVITLFVVD